MHRVLSIFFVVVCSALAWWALELQGKLVFKEKELLTLRKERDAAQAAEKLARAEIAPLQENAERLRKERDEARGTSSGTVASNESPPAKPGEGNLVAGLLGGLLKTMDLPEMEDMIRSGQTAETRNTYGELLKRWNLSTVETDTVVNLLAERELGGLSEMSSLADGNTKGATVLSFADSMEKETAKVDERLKTVLGLERMKELEAFEAEREREEVMARYSEHLDINGSSLDPKQRTQLADLVHKESDETEAESDALAELATGRITDEKLANLRKATGERQARIVQKASSFLSPDQVNGLQSAFREESNEQDVMFRLLRNMTKNTPTDAAAPKAEEQINKDSPVVPAKP